MKPGAMLLNVGRGTAVDTGALAAALREGRLGGAGLDVTDPEPLPPDHPLWDEPRCLITPHNSGKYSLPQTLENIVQIFARNLRHAAAGEGAGQPDPARRALCDRRNPGPPPALRGHLPAVSGNCIVLPHRPQGPHKATRFP